MILAIDIGNSNIAMGLFKGKKLVCRLRIPTDIKRHLVSEKIREGLAECRIAHSDINYAVISSVVPKATSKIKSILKNGFSIRSRIVGQDIKVPIENLYNDPNQVGRDRLVNAYACSRLYGYPAIVVDFGTATTFDYIDQNGAYCGGLITPGVLMTIESLYKRAFMLPKIELKKPKSLVGKDTTESIRSGILYGMGSMSDGISSKIKAQYANKRKIITVATGGLAPLFMPFCKEIQLVDKDLTLKGLQLLSGL
ncbi:type III pantothenate kinase [Candidatus Omnitrophota bacterium]